MLDSSVLVGIIRGEPDTGRLLGLLRATNVFSCQAELVEQTAGAGPAEGVPGSDCKRVEEADAGLLEAGVVARDNDQVVGLRAPRREDLRAILPTASPFQLPMPSNEAAERPRRRPLETGAPFPFAQQQNAESQLAEDYGIDGLFTLVAPEPFDHLGNGAGLVGSLNMLASTRYLTARRSIGRPHGGCGWVADAACGPKPCPASAAVITSLAPPGRHVTHPLGSKILDTCVR